MVNTSLKFQYLRAYSGTSTILFGHPLLITFQSSVCSTSSLQPPSLLSASCRLSCVMCVSVCKCVHVHVCVCVSVCVHVCVVCMCICACVAQYLWEGPNIKAMHLSKLTSHQSSVTRACMFDCVCVLAQYL